MMTKMISCEAADGLPSLASPSKTRMWMGFLLCIYTAVTFANFQRLLIPDEIWFLLAAEKHFSVQLEFLRQDMLHPPVAAWLIRGWQYVFGTGNASIKLLPALLGLPVLIINVLLAKKVTKHWMLASFLMSIPWLRAGGSLSIFRNYGLFFLLSTVLIMIWFQWREAPDRKSLLILWVVVMAVGLNTSLLAVLLLLGFFVATVFLGRSVRACSVSLLCFVFVVPWISFVLPVYFSRTLEGNLSWLQERADVAIAGLPYDFMSGEDPGNYSLPYPFGDPKIRREYWGAAALAHALLLGLAAYRFVLKGNPKFSSEQKKNLGIFIILTSVPILVLALSSIALRPMIHARYLAFVSPAYWLVVVLLMESGGKWARVLVNGFMIPWVVASLAIPFVHHLRPNPTREALSVIASASQPQDSILFDLNTLSGWRAYYEWTHASSVRRTVLLVSEMNFGIFQLLVNPVPVERLSLPPQGQIWLLRLGDSPTAIENYLESRGSRRLNLPSSNPLVTVFENPTKDGS